MQALTAGDVNDIRIGRRHRDRADRLRGLTIEKRVPSSAVVIRSPHTAIDYADIADVGLTRNAGDGTGSAAAQRSDRAPMPCLREVRKLLGNEQRRAQDEEAERNTRTNQCVLRNASEHIASLHAEQTSAAVGAAVRKLEDM